MGWKSHSTNHLSGYVTAAMISYANSQTFLGGRAPIQTAGHELRPTGCLGLPCVRAGVYGWLFLRIQYNRIASLRATMTLAIPLYCFLCFSLWYARLRSGSRRAARCPAATSNPRSRGLPCLLLCPNRLRLELQFALGIRPRRPATF